MPTKTISAILILLSFSCNNNPSVTFEEPKAGGSRNGETSTNPYRSMINIPLPAGFKRIPAENNSFAGWLRKQPLKNSKTVYLYDGSVKKNQLSQFAVLDISTGNQNLQQCADAVMRLRAEYLFDQKNYEAILFTDNAGTKYPFKIPYTRNHFNQYLPLVFGMCGSASLSKQLNAVADLSSVMPGDVLIRGGFPGHAVIIMDVAQNAGGEKIFMLAQSFMPAQDIHVLVNPLDKDLSPWYRVNPAVKIILTPEYVFYSNELKRW